MMVHIYALEIIVSAIAFILLFFYLLAGISPKDWVTLAGDDFDERIENYKNIWEETSLKEILSGIGNFLLIIIYFIGYILYQVLRAILAILFIVIILFPFGLIIVFPTLAFIVLIVGFICRDSISDFLGNISDGMVTWAFFVWIVSIPCCLYAIIKWINLLFS